MQRQRTVWRPDRGGRALKRLAQIEASIAMLADDDLLDLADIFTGNHESPLGEIASIEMAKRKISL